MRRALFDTNILIDHLKGKPEATRLLLQYAENGMTPACSVITILELQVGARPDEEDLLHHFMDALEKIEVTAAIASSAAGYLRLYRKSHGINMADALLAATAAECQLDLLTMNTRHYPMPDIQVVRPY